MKTILMIACLLCAAPALAADAAPPAADPARPAEAEKPAEPEKPQAAPGEYACKYFTVKLPDDWKAFLPPTERQGMLSALFGKDNQSVTVAMTVTPHGGLDLKEVAAMFAQQFKSLKPPVEKNGQFVFNITRNDLPGQVWVSGQGPLVMITAVAGNQKEGLNFLKNNVTTEEYKDLFPR